MTAALAEIWRRRPTTPPQSRAAAQDLSYGTLRSFARGEAILARLVSRPLPGGVHALLLVALHRLDARPEQAHTIVDQTVQACSALSPGHAGLCNAVLRNSLREALPPQTDEARWQHPAWWVTRVRKTYPESWQDVLAAGNTHPPMSLRANARKLGPGAALADLVAAGHPVTQLPNGALLLERPCPVRELPGFAEGRYSVQDAGAQWAAPWLDLAAGQRVLDACAAPGGKAAHILESADVDLDALELDPERAARIRENLDRLGLKARVVEGDARTPRAWWDGRPYDRILADVPCSASGVVRRHPDIKWLRRSEDIARFAATQAEILDALWSLLKPGGKMLYVTCSVFSDENGQQIARFAARHADVRRLPLAGKLERQLLPGPQHDGFYYALLEKRP